MLCPNCQQENQANARFCIFCGTPLQGAAAEESRQRAAVNEEIASLREMLREVVSRITKRLDELEKGQPATPLQPPLPEIPAIMPEPQPEPETEPAPPKLEPVPGSAEPPVPERPAVAKEWEWEQILGGSWLARIGVIALIIGIGFFLKFAFDNNWLGPAGRVILGIVAGLAMLGIGYRWRNRYPVLTRVLTGGGIAVLYLAIFASFAIYDLVNFYVAFAFLFLVSIASATLALRYESMSLATIGIIGAFVAPFILGAFRRGGLDTGDAGQAIQLMVYIIIVDIGVLALSAFRNWRWFTLLALFCSLVSFGVWHGEYRRTVSLVTIEVLFSLIFLVFTGATTFFHIVRHRVPQVFDFVIILINAAAYFGISLGLMWDDFRGWMGLFVFLMAFFYGALSYAAFRRRSDSTLLSSFTLGIAMVFFAVAIPVQIGDKAWTTIAWAAEGTLLVWLARRMGMPAYRFFAYAIFLAVAFRLMIFDTTIEITPFQPVFNERFLAFIASIAAMAMCSFLLRKAKDAETLTDHLIYLGAANFFTLWLIGVEIFTYSHQAMTLSSSLNLIVFAVLVGITVLHFPFWRREAHTAYLAFVSISAVAFIVISIFVWDELREWMGTAYFLLAFYYLLLSYLAMKKGAGWSDLSSVSRGIGVIVFTAAIAIQLGDAVWTTIGWAIEGAVLIWLFFRLRITELRHYGYLVFTAMAIRLIFRDTQVDITAFQPVLNERFMAFIVSIAAMYAAGYPLLRYRRTAGLGKADVTIFFIAVNFLTIWLLSFEVWNYFGGILRTADEPSIRSELRNAQNLSLTAVWAIYAVICLVIGIWKRWRYLRLGALAFLFLPIAKVFVYDVFRLDLAYRIGAFIGLGVLLLTSAYLYQRYSKVIKEVLIKQ